MTSQESKSVRHRETCQSPTCKHREESKGVPVEVLREALDQIAAKKCISTSVDYQSDCPCAAHIARRALLSSPSAEAAPDETTLDSPNFKPKALAELEARGFERINNPRSVAEAAPEPDHEVWCNKDIRTSCDCGAAPTQEKG